MKTLLFCLLALPLMGSPIWVNKGEAVPTGLLRWPYAVLDTGSMRPMIRGGEIVWYSLDAAHVGDWVLFRRSDGQLILHAVTAENKRAVYTSGISSPRSDGWSNRSKVVGVVRYIERPAISHLAQVR